ncbi:hypothetical protein CEXT_444821 [Caerostris extrusa]|uniref:Uncharacterized protein n=1 Tax=Caerostris extrusa TaxID=172846 RepID=A0AAV4N3F8_CAEEX|nr:hypothetical protein CEXT_444821 [Caerostris extrusa]
MTRLRISVENLVLHIACSVRKSTVPVSRGWFTNLSALNCHDLFLVCTACYSQLVISTILVLSPMDGWPLKAERCIRSALNLLSAHLRNCTFSSDFGFDL